MRTLGLALCFACAGILACATSAAPVEYAPPPEAVPLYNNYQSWWREIEKCSGRRANYEGVRWRVMNGEYFMYLDAVAVLGVAYPTRRVVVVALGSVLDPFVIRHEALHLIASPDYHDPEMYQRKCAHLVLCSSNCLRDSLPPLKP